MQKKAFYGVAFDFYNVLLPLFSIPFEKNRVRRINPNYKCNRHAYPQIMHSSHGNYMFYSH